mgnify:CR=1 FL=1
MPSSDASARTYGYIAQQIRQTISTFTGPFTVNDVLNALAVEPQPDRATVSGALLRLMRNGLIRLVARGSGKRPSRYISLGVEQPKLLIDHCAMLKTLRSAIRKLPRYIDDANRAIYVCDDGPYVLWSDLELLLKGKTIK